MIATPFLSHSVRSITPISFLSCPYITCLRYFGVNTMWYLQFALVCDRLSLSIWMPPWFDSFGWQTSPILPQEASFVYLRIAISFLYHSHSEWYLTIKSRAGFSRPRFFAVRSFFGRLPQSLFHMTVESSQHIVGFQQRLSRTGCAHDAP